MLRINPKLSSGVLTAEQVERMNAATELGRPAEQHLDGNQLDLNLQPNALLLVEVRSGS